MSQNQRRDTGGLITFSVTAAERVALARAAELAEMTVGDYLKLLVSNDLAGRGERQVKSVESRLTEIEWLLRERLPEKLSRWSST